MRFFANFKAHRLNKKKAAQEKVELEIWEQEHRILIAAEKIFSSAARGEEPADHQLVQKKGEILLWSAHGVFHEAGRTPSQFRGSSAGFSIPIVAGIRFRTGTFQGGLIPGDAMQMDKDSGIVKVTNQRLIFAGGLHANEWQFAKLLSASRNEAGDDFLISVSNRKKTSGIRFSPEDGLFFSRIFSLALYSYENGIAPTLDALKVELADVERRKPKLIR
jgi:hypothetical protein